MKMPLETQKISALTWRLARRHGGRLLFFACCIAIGIAFLFSIGNLLQVIGGEISSYARELLAGDFEVSSYRPFEENTQKALESITQDGVRSSYSIWFASMLNPLQENKTPFLVSVKVIDEMYPLYGALEVEPMDYRKDFFEKPCCLLDEAVSLQHGLKIGDQVKLGEAQLTVTGFIKKEPGRMFNAVSLAPRIMVSESVVEQTKLLQFGSRIRRSYLFALPKEQDNAEGFMAFRQFLKDRIEQPNVNIVSYKNTQNNIRELMRRQSIFFFLVSIVTLLVGIVGMAASITTFLNEQLETVGTLRCLGVRPPGIFQIYFRICLLIGLLGGLIGCAIGVLLTSVGLQTVISVLELNIRVPLALHWKYFVEGFGISCLLTVGINFYKIRALAKISPMEILRGQVREISQSFVVTSLITVVVILGLFLYAQYKIKSWEIAGFFIVALVASIAATMGFIVIGLKALEWLHPLFHKGSAWHFSMRQGIRQLIRQKSRTLVFLLSLTIGFTLLQTLNLVYQSITQEVTINRSQDIANMFIIDAQQDQIPTVLEISEKYREGDIDVSPLIRARMVKINDAPIPQKYDKSSQQQKDRQRMRNREFNLTYKDKLNSSETIVEGQFWQPGEDTAQISVEQGFSQRAGVGMGDRLTFDIQGVEISGTITSIRKIDWLSMKPNFFVVFPPKIVSRAPKTIIASLRIPTTEKIADFQKELATKFSNISVINTSKIVDTVQTLLGYFLTALKIAAWFCVAVGGLILVGTFSMGHQERTDQVALLRTIGCQKRSIVWIDAVEFLTIGVLTAGIASTISFILAFIVTYNLDISIYWSTERYGEILLMIVLPLAIGIIVNWKTYGASVMENLRREL